VRRSDGSDALDLRAGIEVACNRLGILSRFDLAACTVCDPNYYSWRAHQDQERHALVVWRESSEPTESS
jgi:copper oxidase (laccase) domain-containing protein